MIFFALQFALQSVVWYRVPAAPVKQLTKKGPAD